MTVIFERKSDAETEAREGGRKRIEGSKEKHIFMVKTDQIFDFKNENICRFVIPVKL
jgi:hypothetical protein